MRLPAEVGCFNRNHRPPSVSGSPAVGATVQLDGMGEFIVTGVLPDPPHRSHIRYDFLVSYATIHTMSEEELADIGIDGFDQIWRGLTYVLLGENGSREMLDQALAVQTAAYSARSEKLAASSSSRSRSPR